MLQNCESLQEKCRRVIIRTVGSRKLLRRLPVPRKLVHWLRVYDEPAAFDPNCSSDEVVFSNNNETITFTGSGYSTTLILTPDGHGYTSGKHEWVFYFNRCRGQVAVCLVTADFKRAKSYRTMPAVETKIGWAYNQIGILTFEVPIWEAIGGSLRHESYHTWDMIGLLVDLDKGTIGFMKNGRELGTAFCDINLKGQEVYPGVSLCSGREQVTIVTSRTYL
ncbi:hypothetical protein P5673_008377 [Acropora cervicornis]|uniref:B30.2/SPRY domain-containing protein n=1 Tax=Acropora cervicornis TaxID=6130 RepID=A0AAD9VB32_ACRCE|nr:hypothetical protein P5673_008377 [Acropora cervicornis]